MKKRLAWILVLFFMCIVASVGAEQENDLFFAQFEGMEWSFSSGAGGWSTDMRILPDGSFSGEYHDSEMGDTSDEYPDGTIYGCAFTGRMSFVEQLDENTWKIRVDKLNTDGEVGQESIDEGLRFIVTDPYGISESDEMILYRPGTPVDFLSEEMQMWAHLFDQEEAISELDNWFLSSELNESGFVGYWFDANQ